MASLDDILTATKNVVSAINNASKSYLAVNGQQGYPGISTPTTASKAAGRLAQVSVVTAGSTPGTIYDSNSAGTTKPIYAVPNTIGSFFINIPVLYGIYVVPGTGQVIAISYST
jgi:hypothetical protein